MNDSVAMFPFEYVLDHDCLQIHCGQMLIRQVPYSEIESIQEGFSLMAANWCNLMPFQYVTIKLTKGLVRQLVLNPPDRQVFMQELTARRQMRVRVEAQKLATA